MKPIKRSIDIYELSVRQLHIIHEALETLEPTKYSPSEIRRVLDLVETLDALPGHKCAQIEVMY